MFRPTDDAGDLADASPLSLAVAPAEAGPLLAFVRAGRRWLGPASTILLVGAIILEGPRLAMWALAASIPASPVFWLLFAASYLVLPTADWIIYRRLWGIPAAGFLPLLQKLVSNEMLFGYSGEIYLYAWAQRRLAHVAAPFGAIKDVAILSAAVANATTLAVVLLASPFASRLGMGGHGRQLYAAAALLCLLSLAVLLLRGRLFTLPVRDLRFIALVHAGRLVATMTLTALLWHYLLPAVPAAWWLLLAALRLVVGRLPIVTNRDLLFAAIAVVVVGAQPQLAAMLTMLALLVLAAHLLVAALLAAHHAIEARAATR